MWGGPGRGCGGGGRGGARGGFFGKSKTRRRDIISFSFDYLSKSEAEEQTSISPSSPIPLDYAGGYGQVTFQYIPCCVAMVT